MFSAFQSNAFQNAGYQIVRGAITPDNGWLGGGIKDDWDRYFDNLNRARADQARLAKEIKDKQAERDRLAEQRRLDREKRDNLLLSERDAEILALQEVLELQRLDALLEELNARLWRLRIEEDDILVIIMALQHIL